MKRIQGDRQTKKSTLVFVERPFDGALLSPHVLVTKRMMILTKEEGTNQSQRQHHVN